MHQQHPLSAAFPAMSEADFDALRADIAAHGQREPVVLHEGMVLDGWHRYRACLATSLAVDERVLPADEDPVAFVKSRNLHRRHLNETQRAAAVVACSVWLPRGRQEKCAPGADLLPTAEAMAREADVGVRTIVRAKTAHAAGLGDAMRDGKVSAKRAAEIAKLPEPERAAAVEAPSPRPAAKAAAPAPAAAPPAAKTVQQAEAEQIAEDAYGGLDPLAELEQALKEIDQLRAELAATEADDLKAETLKWRRIAKTAERGQGEAMDRAAEREKREKWAMSQLRRCGKAVGEEDPTKIARAVEKALQAQQPAAA